MAEAFCEVIENHKKWFETIEFAIPGENENHRAFAKQFASVTKNQEEQPLDADTPFL